MLLVVRGHTVLPRHCFMLIQAKHSSKPHSGSAGCERLLFYIDPFSGSSHRFVFGTNKNLRLSQRKVTSENELLS